MSLAEQAKAMVNSHTCLNGGVLENSSSCNLKTLSGYEAADERNTWESFRHLLAEEDVLENEASGSVVLMVSVEDTGIGIPWTAQDRVFTPFMQADSSTSRNFGGTGIGLSISKCLVELMGGHISFASRPRIGSTFSFTAYLGRCSKVSCLTMKKPRFEDLPSSFRGQKALVVDDKLVRAAVTKYHLKRLGIHVEVASSMRSAAAAVCVNNGSLTNGYVFLLNPISYVFAAILCNWLLV